jgi:hypothetical protein
VDLLTWPNTHLQSIRNIFFPQQQELKKKTCLGKDKLRFFLYKNEHLVRFIDFNLGKHVEPFFSTYC